MEAPPGFQHVYAFELLCEDPPVLNRSTLLQALIGHNPAASPLPADLPEDVLAFVLSERTVELEGRKLAPQVLIARKEAGGGALNLALGQSWRFPQAAASAERAAHTVLLSDLFGSLLPYRERVDVLRDALAAAMEELPCLAVHSLPTQQIFSPQDYLEALQNTEWDWLLVGFINVRLFPSGGAAGDILMDTLGLAALGLPDLQVHFRGLDPNLVAEVLFSTALQLFEHEEIPGSEQGVVGLAPGERWTCRREKALAVPGRAVIALDPGPLHRAASLTPPP